jgi:hypothetical protein
MLSPGGFSFHIKKLPELNFFVQSVEMPGIALGYAEMATPFKKLPIYGDHMEYSGDLSVNFKVNEDLGNYIEIHNWLKGIAFPDEFQQFADISDPVKEQTGDGVESDGYLMVLSSAMNPLIRIDFENLFPINLGGIRLDSRDASIEYIESTVDFKFSKYKFTPL